MEILITTKGRIMLRWACWLALIAVAAVIMPGSGYFEPEHEIVYLQADSAAGAAKNGRKPCGCKDKEAKAPAEGEAQRDD